MSQTNSTTSGTKTLINKLILINSFLILLFSFSGFLKGENIYYIIGIWAIFTFVLYCYAAIKKEMNLKLFLVYLFFALFLISLTYYQQIKH